MDTSDAECDVLGDLALLYITPSEYSDDVAVISCDDVGEQTEIKPLKL
jgi:hypothetical protein